MNNEDKKEEANDMSGLRQCVFTDGEKLERLRGLSNRA